MLDEGAFERMNEADIREEVIAPLLRRLGYESGTDHDVIREQLLRYPRQFLGRKDSKKDPELRGKADYILEIRKRLRWVIEAKPPNALIESDDIQQAWTYANHPEIRAVYFVICNGRSLLVFRTVEGPNADSLLGMEYKDFESNYLLLEDLLAPEAVLRDFPETRVDIGLPIARGLRSIARISNGIVRFEQNNLNMAVLNEFQTVIREGAVERDEDGRLVAFLNTVSPSRSLQLLNDRLGLSTFEMFSSDRQLSTDTQHPTAFVYAHEILLPAGEKLLDVLSWTEVSLPSNITCLVNASAQGTYTDGIFAGSFTTNMRYSLGFQVVMSGSFEIHLI
jgi:predicted type IV restriction endonuclease